MQIRSRRDALPSPIFPSLIGWTRCGGSFLRSCFKAYPCLRVVCAVSHWTNLTFTAVLVRYRKPKRSGIAERAANGLLVRDRNRMADRLRGRGKLPTR